jgi:hypothetical protein
MVNIKIIIPIIIVIIIAGVILFNSEQEIIETEIKEEPWHASGPFSIDKIEYNLGEKIFIIVNDLKTEDKGEVVFFRPLNNTHWSTYIEMGFDGSNKTQFNLYFEPKLGKLNKICSTNDLVGTWIVKFIGTEYSDINFEILNQTSSWDVRTFDPVC